MAAAPNVIEPMDLPADAGTAADVYLFAGRLSPEKAPQRMLAVTADDVRRMLKVYFDPKTRTVGIYRTKAATASR